jgi:hypothetical protein
LRYSIRLSAQPLHERLWIVERAAVASRVIPAGVMIVADTVWSERMMSNRVILRERIKKDEEINSI